MKEDDEKLINISSLKVRTSEKLIEEKLGSEVGQQVMITDDPLIASSQSQSEFIQPSIGLDQFDLIRVLGRGGYGKVMLVCYKPHNKLYAMKILRKDTIEKTHSRLYTYNERNILVMVNHPFIVHLHFAFQTQTKLYLIMDFMSGGELFYHLAHSDKFNEDKARFYCAEIVLALEYLHSKQIVYRDLKPENILLDTEGHIRITDFGLSKVDITQGEMTNTLCGTFEYMAPEIFLKCGHDFRADWYSLGTLLYLMLTGAPPFYSKNKHQMLQNRLSQPIRMRSWFSDDVQDLLKGLLQVNPEKRLGANGSEEVKRHAFFRTIDWKKLIRRQVNPPQSFSTPNENAVQNFDKVFTNEPVQDTPITSVPPKDDNYEKFTFVKKLDSMDREPSYLKRYDSRGKSTADQFPQ